ncbi:MAG: hypothetical protein WC889_12980, partial [Myxococcota bacterium]
MNRIANNTFVTFIEHGIRHLGLIAAVIVLFSVVDARAEESSKMAGAPAVSPAPQAAQPPTVIYVPVYITIPTPAATPAAKDSGLEKGAALLPPGEAPEKPGDKLRLASRVVGGISIGSLI